MEGRNTDRAVAGDCDIQMQFPEDITRKLEGYLETYDTILLFHDTVPEIRILLTDFCRSEALRYTKKNVMVMAVTKDTGIGNGQYCQITENDYRVLCSLYHMYEFSDRILVMDANRQFGSLVNYVRTGMLTMEEMFEALLHGF